MIWTYGAIAVFGVLGCWARFAQSTLVQLVYGRDFPYATMTINVMGSFLMGFLFVETLERLTLAPWIRTGVLNRIPRRLHNIFDVRDGDAVARRRRGVGEGRALCRSLGRTWFGRCVWRSLYREKSLREENL